MYGRRTIQNTMLLLMVFCRIKTTCR